MSSILPARDNILYNNSDVFSLGENTLKMGVGEKFSTLQSVLDYIATQPNFIEVDTHTDYGEPFPAVFTGIAISDWAQDDTTLTILDSGNDENFTMGHDYWLGINSEDQLYKVISYKPELGARALTVDCERIGASIVAGEENFTIYRPNKWTIVLTGSKHTEQVTINDNICVRFEGSSNTVWDHTEGQDRIIKGANFKYGILEFAGNLIVGDNESDVASSSVLMQQTVWGVKNTIEVRFVEGAVLSSIIADIMSPAPAIGSLYLDKIEINTKANNGLAHLISLIAMGTISIGKCKLVSSPSSQALGMDLLFLDGCKANRILIESLDVFIDDTFDDLNKVGIVSGARVSQSINITNLNISTKATLAGLAPLSSFAVVHMEGASGGSGVPRPDVTSNISISNVNFNMPNVDMDSIYLFRGAAGTTANVTIDNASGRIDNSVGTNVITCLENNYIQQVDYAATIIPDANLGNVIIVGALTADIIIDPPVNPQLNQKLTMHLLTDGTGALRIMNFNVIFETSIPTGIAQANAKAIFEFKFDGVSWVQVGGAAWY